jgi:predicted transcriptional regulator
MNNYRLKPIENLQNRFNRVEEAIHVKNAIRKALKGSETDPDKEKTILTIAEEIGYPTNIVHWYLTSMRKYGIVVETPNREGQHHKWALVSKTLE